MGDYMREIKAWSSGNLEVIDKQMLLDRLINEYQKINLQRGSVNNDELIQLYNDGFKIIISEIQSGIYDAK